MICDILHDFDPASLWLDFIPVTNFLKHKFDNNHIPSQIMEDSLHGILFLLHLFLNPLLIAFETQENTFIISPVVWKIHYITIIAQIKQFLT